MRQRDWRRHRPFAGGKSCGSSCRDSRFRR
jgi:hypothetical protein